MSKRNPFGFEITLAATERPDRYVRGMTMVGCLKHDQLVMIIERDHGWECPVCGFVPRDDAPPLVVTAVDFQAGTITVK